MTNCIHCQGTGNQYIQDDAGNWVATNVDCPSCQGTGIDYTDYIDQYSQDFYGSQD